MPVRLVCPSCSATLSVKDEYAGRAVKCPKCGGVIPASAPSAASPALPAPPAVSPPPSKAAMPALPPPPTPQTPALAKSPFEELDEPAKPSGPKITGRPAGKPVAKSDSEDLPDDEDDDKPAKRKGRDEDRGPRGGKRDRDLDDADDDRPSRAKRARGDDDDDDGPRTKKGGGGSTAVIIIGMIGFFLLTCCGGVGYGVYWFYNRAKETVQQVKDDIEKTNSRVTQFNYEQLKVGTMTRSQAEVTLGTGKLATSEDLQKAFPNNADLEKMNKWVEKVGSQRAVIWRNGDDYLLVAFHPNAEATSRVQMKEWRPKGGANASAGEPDDAKFLAANPPGGGPPIPVKAEELAQAFKDNETNANTKYKNKNVLVEGKLDDLNFGFDGEVTAMLVGAPPAPGKVLGTSIRVVVVKADINKVLNLSRGQTVKLKGKCDGLSAGLFVDVLDGSFDSSGNDAAPTVTAAALLAEHAKSSDVTDEKYRDKPITLTNAMVESKDGEASLLLVGGPTKKGATKIKVTLPFDARKQIANLKPGDRVKVKGEYSSSSDNVIYINRAWIAP